MSNKISSSLLTPAKTGKGLIFIVSAPAGTGKTTLVEKVVSHLDGVVESVSFTTRSKRDEEKDGEHYHFVSREDFEEKEQNGDFVESATFLGNKYGTSSSALSQMQAKGMHVVLTIETRGAAQLMGRDDVVSIFLLPPSDQELRRRLEGRQTESYSVIEERLEKAKKEVEKAGQYDYQVVNDQIDIAAEVLRSILIAEAHRSGRAIGR